jgi:o-succinylbenzoate synthase
MQLSWERHDLRFLKPAKTSRGEYASKTSWLVFLTENQITGMGEASPLPDLSIDGEADIESVLNRVQHLMNENTPFSEISELMKDFPSVRFALESAWLDLKNGGTGVLFPTSFTGGKTGIPINGLVWMNSVEEMLVEAYAKIKAGFRCIKFKVGALNPDSELRMLETIRQKHNAFSLEIRLDANGAWSADDAQMLLREFSRYDIHSIEQPIKKGQLDAMAEVCAKSSIPIALDEELIGVDENDFYTVLKKIQPAYIVLKPSLLGGFGVCDQWIKTSQKLNVGWWATSALEGNVGLSAIAQWVAGHCPNIAQGLGTGLLFENNFTSQTQILKNEIYYVVK